MVKIDHNDAVAKKGPKGCMAFLCHPAMTNALTAIDVPWQLCSVVIVEVEGGLID